MRGWATRLGHLALRLLLELRGEFLPQPVAALPFLGLGLGPGPYDPAFRRSGRGTLPPKGAAYKSTAWPAKPGARKQSDPGNGWNKTKETDGRQCPRPFA